MVFTHTPTLTFRGLVSILASPPAQNMAMPRTAAQAATTTQMFASQAATVQRRSLSVRMLTATVGVLYKVIPLILPKLPKLTRSKAFDDQTSTFIIPSGGGFEVTFCPTGRSSNILKVYKQQLTQLSQTGSVSESLLEAMRAE